MYIQLNNNNKIKVANKPSNPMYTHIRASY